MNLSSQNKIKVEGGMASMTDLVFLLLIFFIIMSLMANSQTPLDLPKSDENLAPDSDPVTPTVLITEDNLYVVTPGGDIEKPMTFEEIKPLVQEVVLTSKNTKLKIAGHRNAKYEAVFQVLALAQANEWDPVIAYNK